MFRHANEHAHEHAPYVGIPIEKGRSVCVLVNFTKQVFIIIERTSNEHANEHALEIAFLLLFATEVNYFERVCSYFQQKVALTSACVHIA